MSTVSYGVVVDSTEKRHRQRVMVATDSIPDVDYYANVKRQLSKGESFTVTPTKLFVCSTNGVKILIRLTVGGSTVVLPITTNISLPIDSSITVSIVVENPSDNDTDLPAAVSYLTV